MKIKIKQCYGEYESKSYSPRAATVAGLTTEEVVDLAVKKIYGSRAFLWEDNGLKDRGIYGQICKPVSPKLGGGNTCLTGRVRIDIE